MFFKSKPTHFEIHEITNFLLYGSSESAEFYYVKNKSDNQKLVSGNGAEIL